MMREGIKEACLDRGRLLFLGKTSRTVCDQEDNRNKE
jgi:hypothetical protein